MRRLGRWVGAVLFGTGVTLAGVVAGAVPAHACSCVQVTDDAAFEGSDLVFTGRLVTRKDTPAGLGGSLSSGDRAVLTFAVDRVFKGQVSARQRVSTSRDGASCGWELAGEGPFLVFAQGAGASVSTSLCSGNRAGAAPAAWGDGAAPVAGQTGPPEPFNRFSLRNLGLVAGLVAALVAVGVAVLTRRDSRRSA